MFFLSSPSSPKQNATLPQTKTNSQVSASQIIQNPSTTKPYTFFLFPNIFPNLPYSYLADKKSQRIMADAQTRFDEVFLGMIKHHDNGVAGVSGVPEFSRIQINNIFLKDDCVNCSC